MFLAYLLPLTGQACWLAWRAVTDKRDWRVMTSRIGWHVVLWLPALCAIPVVVVGVMKAQWLLIGFSLLWFQGISEIIKKIAVMRGDMPDPTPFISAHEAAELEGKALSEELSK